MLFNIIVFLLILLITGYLANQGMVSSLLALVTATFASVLAMGLMNLAAGAMTGYFPDMARGISLLVLFLVAFVVCRFAADMAVPANIRLPMLFDRSIAGVAGFFTALVVMGTTVIGIEMLPLPRVLLGYDRFPSPNAMQKTTDPADEQIQASDLGAIASPVNTWLAPERFTLAIWDGVSGRALGGQRPWSQVHPDLSIESYGYRNTVDAGSNPVVPPDLFSVKAAWTTTEPKDLEKFKIPPIEPGKRIVMVRTAVTKGEKPTSADSDGFFRISATQIRLVTDKSRQYYPIGHLFHGTEFEPMPLNSGHLIDDFVGTEGVIEDWIFKINDDEKPNASFVEMKQLARASLADVKEKPSPALGARNYPPLAYLKDLSELKITMTAPQPMTEAFVWLLQPKVSQSAVIGEVQPGYDLAEKVFHHSTSWTDKPGVPLSSSFQGAFNQTEPIVTGNATDQLGWSQVMDTILLGKATQDPLQNLNLYTGYFKNTLVPLWKNSKTLLKSDTIKDGTVTLYKIPKGDFTIMAMAKTDGGFYAWWPNKTFSGGSSSMELTADTANFRIVP